MGQRTHLLKMQHDELAEGVSELPVPLAVGEAPYHAAVQPSGILVVYVLGAGGQAEFRFVQQSRQPTVLPVGPFLVHQQPNAFFER